MKYFYAGVGLLVYCLIVLAFIVLTIIISFKKSKNSILKRNFIFTFLSFLAIYAILILAGWFSDEKYGAFTLFSLINETSYVTKFKVSPEPIGKLSNAYPIYYADFFIAVFTFEIAAALSVASLFGLKIFNWLKVNNLMHKKSDLVIGYSKNSLEYLKNTKNSVLLGIGVSEEKYIELLKEGLHVSKMDLDSKRLQRYLRKREYNIILFRNEKISYTVVAGKIKEICEKERVDFSWLIQPVKKLLKKGENKTRHKYLNLYFEASSREMPIIKNAIDAQKTNAKNAKTGEKGKNAKAMYMTCFNKYELIARNFAMEHPISKYIPRNLFNENCSLKPNSEINVVFIGFGKVNYSLFKTLAVQFQFAKEKTDLKEARNDTNSNKFESKFISAPVNYYIYDKEESALSNECITQIKYEFEEFFKNCDFPRPEIICKIKPRRENANSELAKKEFKNLVGDNNFTYFIVSLNNDLEDASYAHSIERLLKDKTNYRIFVRAKNTLGENLDKPDDLIYYFGDERKIFSHEMIVDDDLTTLAQRMNYFYDQYSKEEVQQKLVDANVSLGYKINELVKQLSMIKNEYKIIQKWYDELSRIQQDSNISLAVNIPFKVGLLGFEMNKVKTKESDKKKVCLKQLVNRDKSEKYEIDPKVLDVLEAFEKRYINSGMGSRYEDISLFFNTESSNVLAFIEHARWNALYFLSGFRQMKKEKFPKVKENKMEHKDENNKEHACLTTYDGIKEVIDCKYKILDSISDASNAVSNDSDNESEKNSNKTNVYKGKLGLYSYDYISLDNLFAEIVSLGYELKISEK